DGGAYKFLFMAKGGGSANKSFLYQETKAAREQRRGRDTGGPGEQAPAARSRAGPWGGGVRRHGRRPRKEGQKARARRKEVGAGPVITVPSDGLRTCERLGADRGTAPRWAATPLRTGYPLT
ncbi:hypothetical protein ABZ366_26775, partial [Streptomyces sp. NPDC005904]|uniref:hypothetical protein n=1 Tax=Streptomyces sp. NPDC005904 TaxID=3154570 RepID=UPI0033FAC7E0